MKRFPILAALSIKPFLLLWLAEIFSQVAMNMLNFVLIIVAFKLAHSNTAVSGIVLSFTIPAVIFGVFAGIYVDRWNKKNVLILTNVIRAILLLILALTHTYLPAVYILSFLISIATQFFIPAETPMIPVLVPRHLLHSANALFGMGIYGSILAAFALAGYSYIYFGDTNVFIMLSFLFIIAGIFASIIPISKASKRSIDKVDKEVSFSIKEDFQKALSLIASTKKISHSLFLLTLSQILILIVGVIGPGYANLVLGINAEEFPHLFVAPAALGMVIGTIVLGNLSHKVSKEKITNIGVFLSAVALLLLPYGSKVASRGFVEYINSYLVPNGGITSLHFMMFFALILGFANSFVFVPSNTILQEETADSMRGKVYGALNSLIGIFSLLPIIIVGGLADLIGVGTVLLGIGILLIMVWLYRLILH